MSNRSFHIIFEILNSMLKDDDKTEGKYEKFVAVTGVIIKLVTGKDKYIIFDLIRKDKHFHTNLCIDLLINENYTMFPKAIAGLIAALGAFIAMDTMVLNDNGEKFEIIQNFSENRGISLLLKYNKMHMENEYCTFECFNSLSLLCPDYPRNIIIIEKRNGINNIMQCLRLYTEEVFY